MHSEIKGLEDLSATQIEGIEEANNLVEQLRKRSIVSSTEAPALLMRLAEIGDQHQLPVYKAWALCSEADHYRYMGDMKQASVLNGQARVLFEEMQYKRGMSSCYRNEGIFLAGRGDFNQALQSHFKALTICDEFEDKSTYAAV